MYRARKSNLLGKITILFVICFFSLPAQGKYGGGTGEPNDPYLIYTPEQMNEIGLSMNWDDWDKCFKLMTDIDLSGYTGTSFNIIGYYVRYYDKKPFTGVFDGSGHTISNFNYTSTETNRSIGIFGYVRGENAVIKDLGLINPNVGGKESWCAGSLVGYLREVTITNCYAERGSVSGNYQVGALVGRNSGKISNSYSTGSVSGGDYIGGLLGHNTGKITNCYSSAIVSGFGSVGGLVGQDHEGTITNSSATGNVTGTKCVGGLVGDNYNGTITKCYSTGSIIGDDYIGGLVGDISRGTISNCYSTGNVSGDYYVGGLVGYNNYGTITGCYFRGGTEGNEDVGGLVGRNRYGAIANCYATDSVIGNKYVGGLVGEGYRGTIDNSYSTCIVSGDLYIGGLVGENYKGTVTASFWDFQTSGLETSDGGVGLTTAEMQMASTFIGWGCDPVWTIDEGKDYPRLFWENMPGDLLPQLSEFLPGSGTQADPYLIYTSEQLNLIGLFLCDWDKHFKLMADIDLAGRTYETAVIAPDTVNSNLFFDGTAFTGVFDGSGYKIIGLTIDDGGAGNDYLGLFGKIYYGEVKNLGFEGSCVSGDRWVSSLVGRLDDGSVSKCYSTGDSSGSDSVGGLVGRNDDGSVSNCYSTGDASGSDSVGGLVGRNDDGSVFNCYATGNIEGDDFVGGLVGRNEGPIINCYSTGSVAIGRYRGGLVGYNKGTVLSSFWDIETSGRLYSAGGRGLLTDQMQTMSTFTDAGWDFVGEAVNGIEDIWFIGQQDYPHLLWEGMEVPVKLTPRKLNCRSYGKWVKARLTLPQGFTVADVNSNRPAVLHSFGFESTYPLYVFVNKDKVVEIEAAFEREAVCSLSGNWPEELTVAGFLADGSIFLGTSKIRIIHPGMKVIEDLASYWLQGNCVHPDFCDGIDMNRDSLVNLLDYALLMNINVEFVTDE